MFVIGVDVHVRNSYFHINRADGTTFKKGRVPNTLADFSQFMAPLEGHPAKVVLESTTNSRPIYLLLKEYALQARCDWDVRVLHARNLRLIAESESKCDKFDGGTLARLGNSGLRLSTSYMPDQEVFELRELTRGREALVDGRTMLKCQAHAVLHRRGILLPEEMDLFTRVGRAWARGLSMDESGRQTMERLYSLIDAYDDRIHEADVSLIKASRSARWKADYDLVYTMPGVGLVTGMTVLAELADIKRFASRAAVSNFVGLIPINRSSNDKNWKGQIKREGPRHLRRVIVEAAQTAVRDSEKYRTIYQKLVARDGRKKLVATTAIARRMLEDMYTILKTRSAFHEKSSTDGQTPSTSVAGC